MVEKLAVVNKMVWGLERASKESWEDKGFCGDNPDWGEKSKGLGNWGAGA